MAEIDRTVRAFTKAIDATSDLSMAEPDVDQYLDKEPEPEGRVFELGLVLAGAISAGAYSAGVLDYLVEALDGWEAAKAAGLDVPTHSVRIRVIAGASAGSMNGAIAAVALQYDFPHVRSEGSTTNPFYDAWVKRISFDKLLALNDLVGASPVVRSVLDSTVLQSITDDALNYKGKVRRRPYLDGRVRFLFTQGGLRGIPYFLDMNGNTGGGLAMSLHKTYRSFSIGFNGQPVRRRPDDLPLTADIKGPKARDVGWMSLGNAALGSGAFPIGLAARQEKRNVADLNWRYVTGVGSKTIWLKPAWAFPIGGVMPTPPSPYFDEFVVDGGTMDNEPMDLARAELAGTEAHNEQRGNLAKRAIIMVDPFPDALITDYNQQTSGRSGDIISSGMGLLGAWKNQARFNPLDLALALDDQVYSRFLIAPSRKDANGEKGTSNGFDLASGALGGFGGFLSEENRHHDYLLGRRNCQQFLASHFSLIETNPLFQQDEAFRQRWSIAGKNEIPIIPLVGTLATPEPRPEWPTKPVDLDALKDLANTRLKRVVDASLAMAGISGWKRWLSGMGVWLVKGEVLNRAMEMVQKDLKKRNLPTEPSAPYMSQQSQVKQ